MTWHFDSHGNQMDVYDHEGERVASDVPIGGDWHGDFPNEVFDVMQAEVDDAHRNGDIQRIIWTVADAALEDIEQGTPPTESD